MKCRVKADRELPHGGQVLPGGTDVELRPDLAVEVRHLVDEVLPDGTICGVGAGDQAAAQLAADLASARPHERISILEAARAATEGSLAELDKQIAAERRRLEAAAKPAGKAKSADKSHAEKSGT